MTARKIAEELRVQIADGTYGPGDQLPSRSKMMELFNCSGWTAVNAVNTLRAEGLVVGLPGTGWFVRLSHPMLRMSRNRLSRAESAAGRGTFLSDAVVGAATARSEVAISTRPALEDVAAALDIDLGTELLVRDRLMYADNVPVQLTTSYLPRELTRGTPIENDDTGPGGLYARLEDAGHKLDHFEEFVRIGLANQNEATRLTLPLGAPVFRITRIALSQTRPVEITRLVAAGERFELHYALTAE